MNAMEEEGGVALGGCFDHTSLCMRSFPGGPGPGIDICRQ